MHKHNRWIDLVGRFVLTICLVLTACGPNRRTETPPETQAESDSVQPSAFSQRQPEYYDAPEIELPTRVSPEIDVVSVELPPERQQDPIELVIDVSPALVIVGEDVTLRVTIRNRSGETIQGLTYTDHLESGLTFVSSTGGAVVDGGMVAYDIDILAVEDEISFSYTLRVTSRNASFQDGEVWLHQALLSDEAGEVSVVTNAVIGVGTNLVEGDTSLAIVQEEGGWIPVGDVAVYFPPEAVTQDGLLVVTEQPSEQGDPEVKYEISVIETGDVQTNEAGEAQEQRLAVTDSARSEFAEPVYLEVNFDQVANLEEIPAGQEPYIATYYEEYDVWVKVPILNLDYVSNAALVQTTHFSTWGAGLGSSLPQNGTGALLFDQPYTSLFTGASQYSIPVWTPPGRAGLSPNISLSYSSGTVNGVLGDVQAPWVGVGWNIDSAEIVRKITTSSTGYGYENSFALSLNGALYDLIRDEFQPNRYYVRQNAFLYIELHNYALHNEDEWQGRPPENESGEWWEVVTTDGLRYRFGWNEDSEQLALMYGYACTQGGDACLTPSGPYASSGYAGLATNLVVRRWRVDRVTDTYGNYIEYAYFETQPPESSLVSPYDRSSYLETISYTGFRLAEATGHVEPGYQIQFHLGDRSDVGDIPTQYNVWDLIDEKYLDRIEICYGPCGESGSIVVRTYDLGYTLAAAPNTNGTLTLTSLAISGGNYYEGGEFIGTTVGSQQSSTQSATVRFTYENKPNRASGAGDVFNYPRLVEIENGYGGKLTYTYETDGRSSDSWYNYRVQKVDVENGLGLAGRRSYVYATPVYSGIGSNPNLGELIGYTTVTEKTLDYSNADAVMLEIKHQFGTTGLDIGREYWTEVSWDNTVQQKTVNTYVTDNSAAPSSVWNYRYLAQTENFLLSGGSLALVSKSTYYRDPASGNLLLQSDYLGSSLYRKTYYEYRINPDPDVYIMNTVSRVLLVDANNYPYSDSYYYYGDIIGESVERNMNEIPTHGNATVIQTLTGNDNQTVDMVVDYDLYGNLVESRLYESYGTVNTKPSGSFQATTITYDNTNLHTYAVGTEKALNETSETDYLYSLGIPYRTRDANGWETTTTYDGLGRTLTVTPPGLWQPGVWYSYPEPDLNGQVAAPYAIEMQIFDQTGPAYRSVWGIYDGLGRILQNQVYSVEQGQYLVTEVQFGPQGQTTRQSLPHYVSGNGGTYITPTWTSPYTSYVFDPLGRQVSVTAPGSITSLTSYDGLTVTQTDPNGNLRRQVSDGLGRVIQVQEFTGSTLYATTRYSYDAANRLTQVTDAQLNTTSISYNWLGQKTGMKDPDMGIWTYSYNPTGTLSSQTDAREQTLTFEYDDLNRLESKWNGSTRITRYEYGQAAGELGFRTGMYDENVSISTEWTYSEYGRTVTESKAIDGLNKSTTTESDWLGRVLTLTYPDGEELTYSYDSLGRPDQLTSDSVPLVDLTYSTLGQIEAMTFGDDVVIVENEYAYEDDENYLDDTLRLTSHRAYQGATILMDFSYSYDSNGNIINIADGILGEVITYTYDGLNRLLGAEAVQGEVTIYDQNFSYDKLGNILQVSMIGTVGQLPEIFGSKALASSVSLDDPLSILDGEQFSVRSDEDPPAVPTQVFTNTPQASHTASLTATPSLTPTPMPTPTATLSLNSGLILYWSFENVGANIPDDSGHGYAGVLNNGAFISQAGYSGNGVAFDGVNDYVFTDDAYNATNPTGSFSITLRINPATIPTGSDIPLVQVSGSYSLSIRPDGTLNYSVAGLTPSSVSGPQLPVDTWTYVVAVFDNTSKQLSLYINNNLVSSAAVTGSVYATNQRFSLSPGSSYFQGRMDDVRLYSRALSQSDIANLHAIATATPQASSTPTLTPTPTYTITPTPIASESRFGTGMDGDVTVNGTVNLSTSSLVSGRSCADGVAYSVTQLYGNTVVLSETPASGCLSQSDEILLINLQGASAYANTGRYEFLRVLDVNGSTVTFTNSVIQWFGAGLYDHTNIGVGSGQQRVMILRVPNYNNLVLNGTLTANAFDGYRYGVLAFRVKGALSGSGSMNMDTLGFLGGRGCGGGGVQQLNGQSYNSEIGFSGAGAAGPNYDSRYESAKGAGSGGYSTVGTQGVNGGGAGGRVYGEIDLARIYLGSGGGGEGCDNGTPGGAGGNGGGAILISADTIYLTGAIYARGGPGSGNRPAGGSGGSIWIEGDDVTLNTASVAGGSGSGTPEPGATGRIAVYFLTNYFAYFTPGYVLNIGATPTPTPTPTAIVTITPSFGDGDNGDLNIPTGTSFNINTQTQSLTFQCADGGDAVSYLVTNLSSSSATLSNSPSVGCLRAGDEILLINTFSAGSTVNAGKYEFLRVGGVIGNVVYFLSPKINFYGDNAGDDTNIGTGTGQRRVVVQRVPNYENVTINGTLTGSTHDAASGLYGFIVFRVRGSLTGAGSINATALGYAGGRGCQGAGAASSNGGSFNWLTGSNGAGSAGPDYNSPPLIGGGSGGYRTAGTRGINNGGAGGLAYGLADLSVFYLGSGGGGEGCDRGSAGGAGGNGGGAIFIAANIIYFTGQINSNGGPGTGNRPAGGSGGSVRIEGDSITLNVVTVSGGSGGGTPAPGAPGRIAVFYADDFVGYFTPGYLLDTTTGILDTISTNDFEDGLAGFVSSAPSNPNLSTSAESAYWGNHGLEIVIANNTSLYVQDDSPQLEKSYRARLYFNLDELTMVAGDQFFFFTGSANGTNAFRIELKKTTSSTQIRLIAIKDDNSTVASSWYNLTAGWHALEIQFQAAGAAGANDGAASLYLDGVLKQSLTGIDNDTLSVDTVKLGATYGLDTGTRGTIYIDDFESRRFSYIGLLPDPGMDVVTPTPEPGASNATYAYESNRPHAVTSVDRGASVDTYAYDDNGNMTCRVENGKTYNQIYNSENRMSVVELLEESANCPSVYTRAPGIDVVATWTFTYDGDGNRVRQVYEEGPTTLTTYYFAGGAYEVQVGTETVVRKYYSFAGMPVAMDDGSGLKYFLTDHLGSVVAVTDASGILLSQQRYMPFGEVRPSEDPVTQTDFGYTGQRNNSYIKLMDYRSRWYDPALGRFIQPDTIIPDSNNPQALNRYAYVLGNPIQFNDPTGHDPHCSLVIDGQCIQSQNATNRVSNRIPTDPVGTDYFYNYNSFERSVLQNLSNSGIEGKQIADFILDYDIHIYQDTPQFAWYSAWWDSDNRAIVLNEDDFPDTVGSIFPEPNNPFLVGIVAHEADHIRLTYSYPNSFIPAGLTKYGEIHGWQLGFRVQYNFTNANPSQGSSISRLLTLDLDSPDVIKQGNNIIYDYQKGTLEGWVYLVFYSILPKYP